jgi:phosphate starvation-inducible protein PhoH
VNDVGVFEFGDGDIVRNPLISKILKKYDENRD